MYATNCVHRDMVFTYIILSIKWDEEEIMKEFFTLARDERNSTRGTQNFQDDPLSVARQEKLIHINGSFIH